MLQVDPVLEAQMYVVLAQTVQSLFASFLLVQGLPTDGAAVTKEKVRR